MCPDIRCQGAIAGDCFCTFFGQRCGPKDVHIIRFWALIGDVVVGVGGLRKGKNKGKEIQNLGRQAGRQAGGNYLQDPKNSYLWTRMARKHSDGQGYGGLGGHAIGME